MNLNIFLILFVLSVFSQAVTCQLVGGVAAKKGEFKYLVYIEVEFELDGTQTERYQGGGVIVSPKWVLSAAHNFDSEVRRGKSHPPDAVTILAGAKNIKAVGGFTQKKKVEISAVVRHEKYREAADRYDVALIFLGKSPFQMSERVQPANLARDGWNAEEFKECVIVGWGSFGLDDGGFNIAPDVARKGKAFILPASVCEEHFEGDFYGNYHICYGCHRGCRGCAMAASGDSGSPVVQIVDGEEVVVGIHQASCGEMAEKCSEDSPGQAAEVGKFRGWMKDEMKKREFWESFKDMALNGGAVLTASTAIVTFFSYFLG